MGLFSSKKIVSVSSSVYNLAGDEDKRPNFLRMSVLSTVLSNSDLSDNLTQAYLGGPGIKLRNFISWCSRSGYNDLVGIVTDSLHASSKLDNTVLAKQIKSINNLSNDVSIQSSDIGLADIEWWVEQWILQNNSKEFDTNWEADLNDETKVITITWEDGSISQFNLENFDQTKRYIYAAYNTVTGRVDGSITQGDIQSVDNFPDITGWTVVSTNSNTGTESLTKTVTTKITYSDDTPSTSNTVTTIHNDPYENTQNEYSQTNYLGSTQDTNGTAIKEKITYRYLFKTHGIKNLKPVVTTTTDTDANGVTKTTTVTTNDQSIYYDLTYRDDTQINTVQSMSPLYIFIYQRNSGNTVLDDMFNSGVGSGTYYPYIPMRLWNNFVNEDHYADLYPMSVKALKKATKGNFDKISAQVADNKNIGDVDFTYVVFGVSLNVKENACKKYLWEFLNSLYENNIDSLDDYNKWKEEYGDYTTAYNAYLTWLNAQNDSTNPLYGTKEPSYTEPPVIPNKQIHITSDNNSNINYNITLSWKAMSIAQGTGLQKSDAKKGDLWFVQNASDEFSTIIHNTSTMDTSFTVDNITLYYQVDETNWKSITIWGFTHDNLIYGGKSVHITASDALNDTEESGFIIPLHSDIYANMPLVDSTQMATACCFLVFNCYKVKKVKWYQRGFFKIFLMIIIVIVVIVVAVITWGAGAVAGAGILGASASIGAAIGAVGTTALIVGAIANAMAAIVVSMAITEVSKIALGKKLGALIGAIISAAVTFGVSAASSGLTATQAIASLLDPKNLPIIMNSVMQGVNYISQDIVGNYQDKTQGLLDNYKSKVSDLQEKIWENLGSSPYIDPTLIMDSTQQLFLEDSDSFIGRTLMVGSDYAEMTKSYINDMVSLTINTDLQGVS